MHVLDEIIHTTVRIECEAQDGRVTRGTAFICGFAERDEKQHLALITNKHVVRNARIAHFHMTIADDTGSPRYGTHIKIPFPDLESHCLLHPNDDIDLAAFPIGPIVKIMSEKGTPPFYRAIPRKYWADDSFFNELKALEDVIMIGYPNGMWDAANNTPIARRGMTATPAYLNFEGRPEFLIDCACFPGSSGSPVFLVNLGGFAPKEGPYELGASRLKLIGILWGGPVYTVNGEIKVVPIPTAVEARALSPVPINLGYCIKATELIVFDDLITQRLHGSTSASEQRSDRAGPILP